MAALLGPPESGFFRVVARNCNPGQRRHRLNVLLSGAAGLVAVVAVGVVGGAIALPHLQRDLTSTARSKLADSGISGVAIRFSGQDATLTSEALLSDPARVRQLVAALLRAKSRRVEFAVTSD